MRFFAIAALLLQIYNTPLFAQNDPIFEQGQKVIALIEAEIPNSEGIVNEYIEQYPHSPLIPQIQYKRALVCFNKEDYSSAAKYFAGISLKSLYKEQKEEYLFKNGYCQMRMGNNALAKSLFSRVEQNQNSAYLYPALYYHGYINYVQKDFKGAIPLFERAVKDSRYTLYGQYHILESKFLLKEYDYVVDKGPKLYEQVDSDHKHKVARIISEAYYGLEQPEKAKYYFELYTITGGKMAENDIFYAAMISYTLKNYSAAAESFAQIASSKDSLGQNAAYHLGESYIQLKNKHKAMEAFKTASECSFDPDIQEDALFNYAKLCFDVSRDIKPFDSYLSQYGSGSGRGDEIYGYIATSFLINGDYSEAIDALNKIKNKSRADIVNLQKASFFKALELCRFGSFRAATPYLQTSLANSSYNANLRNLANFWLAECYYRRDNFAQSLSILEGLQRNSRFRHTPEYYTSIYNMGYNYFKMEQYQKAGEYFLAYLNLPTANLPYKNEANVRLADSYFMQRDYAAAAQLYEMIAVEQNYSDLYPAIQAAAAYGLLSQNSKKCALLEEIAKPEHAESPLYSDALYELGRTLVQNVEDEKAEPIFMQLIENPKDSSYYYKSLLEMGMINANRQNYDSALNYYKAIVEKSPVSNEGESALAGIENIYQSTNRPDEFIAYLDEVGLSSVKSADEKESMIFNSAEQLYLSGNYSSAVTALLSYLERYPEGAKRANSLFYIADCYNRSGKIEKAAEYYFKVMETSDESFSELATLNYATLSFKLQHYAEAAAAYESLEKIARLENNRLVAMIGKIESYYMCKEYEKCLYQAAEVKNISNLGESEKDIANYYSAKSYLALSERDGAIPLLKELAKKSETEFGSEASYLLILDAYDAGEFQEVEDLTFALSESGKAKQYWLARSFITLGDSYVERDNIAQAKATFESIANNYRPQNGEDDIKNIVKMRLEKLNELEKRLKNEI